MKSPLLVIAGPTGVGKTATAVALGSRVPLEIVSADSRQVYRFMDVATGKPTPAERAAVPHHLVDVVDPDDRYQAARFRRDAAAATRSVRFKPRTKAAVGSRASRSRRPSATPPSASWSGATTRSCFPACSRTRRRAAGKTASASRASITSPPTFRP